MEYDGEYWHATESDGLRERVQPIVANLPPVEYHARDNGEISYYGASFCIARRLGLKKPLFGRATWSHGWRWYQIFSPAQLVDAENTDLNNLVVSKAHEAYLRQNGFRKSVAVGAPFLYAPAPEVERIPGSILVFPRHSTQCAEHSVTDDTRTYVKYIDLLRKRFSLVVVSLGLEDVRKGEWTSALDAANIPWIVGAWTHDANALVRMHALMRQFEFATSNSPDSHFAYAAHCGCKMSFSGPRNEFVGVELDTHHDSKSSPDIAQAMKGRYLIAEFQEKYPFFFVEPWEATERVDWAFQVLGGANTKPPEEIAELFEWKLRKLPSGRWAPINPHDVLTNDELFAKAVAKSLVGRNEDAFKLTNILKRRHVRLRDVEVIRARYFLSIDNTHDARDALKEELRHFPDNAQANKMFQTLDGDGQTPSHDGAFLDPQPTPEFMDLYLVRKGILARLTQAIPIFRGTLLDVGCGQMPYREHILAQNPQITRYIGLDFATGKYADRRQPDLAWDGVTIPLPDGGADCAMATEVLEHCPDPVSVLREIRRVLVPGGSLFFTTPFLWPVHDAPHDHYRYTPYALRRLLEEAGFTDVRVEALGGWNASLAQMLGLWLRRAPMDAESRDRLTRDLHPFFTELVRTDVVPTDFSKNPMVTGLSGTARAPLASKVPAQGAKGARVVVVSDQFPVLSQTFILDQITGLMDRGINVEHWSMQRMDQPVVHENVHTYGLIESTHYITLPPEPLRADPRRWTQHFLRANDLASLENVAAIHVHFGPNFNKIAPLFAAHPGLFVLVSFHGYDASATFQVKGPDVYAGLFARANMITTPSQFMKDALVRYGCPPDKVVVHHYGKDMQTFAPAPGRDGRQPIRVLSVARLVEKKGLEYALAAFAKARVGFDVEYRIVGDGPLGQTLADLAQALGVADRVVFLGQRSNEDVRREMAAADIFVLTSVTAANGDQEGLPVSLIEAQAMGLPVISSRHAGIPELVVHGETGFLAQERDVDEIAGYMRALLKNPVIREAFSAKAREHVLDEFDLAKLNDALADRLIGRGAEGLTGVYCPICRSRHAQFRPFGTPPRPDALCPSCTALERHRALWLFLERQTTFFTSPCLRLLHFAPEACLESRFRQLVGKGYVTADLLDPKADVRADITDLQFLDASFDVIICSHVLEHVPDDRKAMRELYRVLDDNGQAIVIVPLRGATTEEDLSITDPDERTRRYGQADHVRYYGMDIVDRLQSAGFAVRHVDTANEFSTDDIAYMKLGRMEIFLCRKPVAAQTADAGDSSETESQALRVTARHWATSTTGRNTRWWMHPAILRHINTLVCGSPVDGPWAGLERRMRTLADEGNFPRGLSVGCGCAPKELHLLQEGIVGHFDLFEISPERAALAKASAVQRGIAARANFQECDAFAQDLDDQYDLVYWNNSLHHMFDVRRVLLWSRERLRPGGWLVMDDFVGATRFQWPEAQLEIASKVRRSLPKRLLRDPAHPQYFCPTDMTRPSLASMLATDPSEAADSENILPVLRQEFPDAQIILTGGVVYHLALNDVIANFDDIEDADRLQALLEYDAALAAQGQTQYACAFASKQVEAGARP